MPSWNIHLAHAERLLREEGASRLRIEDENAFLAGNVAPDIYVGFLIPDTSKRIYYRETHIARKSHIPLPSAEVFWNRYIAGKEQVSDFTLGAWAHLLLDHVYNLSARTFFRALGEKPGERLRIAKQGDYALYGRTLPLERELRVNAELIRQAREFPQYTVEQEDLEKAVALANSYVRENAQPLEHPAYTLLTDEFFERTANDAQVRLVAGLTRKR